MLKVLRQVVGVRHPASKPFEKTLYIDRHAGSVILDPNLYACDGLPLCLSRKKPFQVSPKHLQSPLGLPKLWKAPKRIQIELFSYRIR